MRTRDLLKIIVASSLISAALVIFLLRWPLPPPTQAKFQQSDTISFDTGISAEEEVNIRIYESLSRSVVNVTSTRVELNFWLEVIPSQGVGSGFLVDSEGHVITNNHVIEKAELLEVTLFDETKYEAEVIGRDPVNDIAVLKIDCPEKLCRPIKLAEDPELLVGQKVLAIGNPFGLQRTLTTGIISSLARSLETRNGVMDELIQTDAAINPGNSGGPLLNTRGEVIGVNTAIVSRSGENAGIGFAVPVNTLRRILPDLLENGRVLRPWFGVVGISLNARVARAIGAPVEKGYLIERIAPGSSAEGAGLRGGRRRALYGNRVILLGGDILVSLAGEEVSSRTDILRILEDKRPGDRVDLVYYREGERFEKEITLTGEESTRSFRF